MLVAMALAQIPDSPELQAVALPASSCQCAAEHFPLTSEYSAFQLTLSMSGKTGADIMHVFSQNICACSFSLHESVGREVDLKL